MRTLGGFVLRLLAMPSLARRGHDYTSSPARRGAVVYVDPCTADLYDDRLGMTQEVCTQIGVRFVSVWSKGFASMLCNKAGRVRYARASTHRPRRPRAHAPRTSQHWRKSSHRSNRCRTLT